MVSDRGLIAEPFPSSVTTIRVRDQPHALRGNGQRLRTALSRPVCDALADGEAAPRSATLSGRWIVALCQLGDPAGRSWQLAACLRHWAGRNRTRLKFQRDRPASSIPTPLEEQNVSLSGGQGLLAQALGCVAPAVCILSIRAPGASIELSH
jgi:hypothetical protein